MIYYISTFHIFKYAYAKIVYIMMTANNSQNALSIIYSTALVRFYDREYLSRNGTVPSLTCVKPACCCLSH